MQLLTVLLIASIVGWFVVWNRALSGQPLLSIEPRRDVPWGLVDLGLLFFIWIVAGSIVIGVMIAIETLTFEEAQNAKTPLVAMKTLLGGGIATLITGVVMAMLILLKNAANVRDIGLDTQYVLRDLWTGVCAFLLIGGPVYFIQYVLAQWWESTHPIIELVLKNPSAEFFVVAGFSAVIVAPIMEEFVFRVLIQGWCEKLATFRGDPMVLLLGQLRLHEQNSGKVEPTLDTSEDEVKSAPTTTRLLDDNPYASPVSTEVEGDEDQPPSTDQPRHPVWPIFASATLFALMHYSHGPDPIPLFFFALGLGYLYRQTHRVLPCIVVHFLLNALSLGLLVLQAYYGIE